MKHILTLIVGLLTLAALFLVSWLLTVHPEIIVTFIEISFIFVFAYMIGWKILNEFKK